MLTGQPTELFSWADGSLYINLSIERSPGFVVVTSMCGPQIGLALDGFNLDWSQAGRLVGIELISGQAVVECRHEVKDHMQRAMTYDPHDDALRIQFCSDDAYWASFSLRECADETFPGLIVRVMFSHRGKLASLEVPDASRWIEPSMLAYIA